MTLHQVVVCRLDDLAHRECREFSIGEGDWPFKGFVVRDGDKVHAYQNYCVHAGHPLNWSPDVFLTPDKDKIICASHGAVYDIASGLCTGGPCRGKSLRRVDCKIEGGEVLVSGPLSSDP